MKQPQWFSLLGLAARARKLVTGEELVVKDIRKKNVHLVIVANDASDLTKKKLQDKCKFYNVTLKFVADRQELGMAIGKHERVVIGVTDQGFAQKLLSIL
ncbi:50S ribosomal protein L7 [Anaerobacillus arseniciselenatis]|uniref:50S ribosomal protein L7 n=1 Tax=Anaerobacillus arseniciselenatis TaxID=85682 RepID=A0A1S2LC97_9BACI|nr:YlxQ family RNA-binding protein [Anaerobacillus arseniciselenatis]OIJ09944.1 50S ribosomal protein L7 [Anaerobacillus arseniciselenatis]